MICKEIPKHWHLRSRAIAFISLQLLLLMMGQPVFAGGFAAIAYSPTTAQWGISWGWSDVHKAQAKAVDLCKSRDCKASVWVRNAYAALATGDSGKYGWARGNDLDEVIANAIAKCEAVTTNCDWKAWVYSAVKSGQNDGRANVAGPDAPPIEEIGGNFNYDIPGFTGFQQLQSNWCWAATAESIYFAMTGAHLDQSQIAEIHSDNTANEPQDLGKERQSIDTQSCSSVFEEESPRCNHLGNPAIPLSLIGSSLPFDKYPHLNNGREILTAIRSSLENNIPVGIRITWDDGSSHYITVYGAAFAARSSGSGPAEITLRVYDPYDGQRHFVDSDGYKPPYKSVSGTWDGWISLGNFENPNRSIVTPGACPFLSDNDRGQFCR